MPEDLATRQTDAAALPRGEPMRVLEVATYTGPHLYSATPMIRIRLDLGALEAFPTTRLPGFAWALAERLPGLARHTCSVGEPGGFLRRMEDGTWLGHVVEHVALELQTEAGSRTTRGKTRSVRGRPGAYDVMFAYRDAEAGRMAGRTALALVDSLLPDALRGARELDRIHPDDPMTEGLEGARRLIARTVRRNALGPTTLSLVREAERRGIPFLRLDEASLIQLGHGRKQRRIRASITGCTSNLAVDIAGDKELTKRMLAEVGIPVPRGGTARTADGAAELARKLGYPVVVKPLDGNHGRGVTLDLEGEEAVRAAFAEAARISRSVIVEQQFRGDDHRILVVGGEVRAVAQRVPAHVVGDGSRSISALVDDVNTDPRRGTGHENLLTRIVIDEHVLALLAKRGMAPDSVPADGEWVVLRDTANLSTGGTAIDRTDDIHPENAAIARRAAAVVGLDVAGIDFLATDITKSVRATGGGIVEVNAAPGFRMHLEPFEGWARDIARPVLDTLFPEGADGRIPILAITGTNGKTTTTRMVAHILGRCGRNVGMTTTSGVWIGEELVRKGDCSGPGSARMVLRDPTVDAAVLETARGGILREGLAFEECDVGCVLNIQPDHLGLKGIDTLEDLARVKSVVVESVRRGGCSVLNADDPLTVAMARHAGGSIAFFSLNGHDMPDLLRAHVKAGRLAVVHEDGPDGGVIVMHDNARRLPLMGAAEIPATLGGLARFNVANALAAVAMAYAAGLSPPAIRTALQSYSNSFADSPGRLNVHDAGGVRIILDYAHNPASYAAVCDLVARLSPRHRRRIALLACPGDRRDEDIREVGRICAPHFDEIVLRERPEQRGRPDGQVLRLLTEGVLSAGFPRDRLHEEPEEMAAVELTLSLAREGDLILLTPTSTDRVWARVQAFRPPQ